jgi:hypothetical protein
MVGDDGDVIRRVAGMPPHGEERTMRDSEGRRGVRGGAVGGLVAVVVFGLGGGCGPLKTYEGPTRPRGEVALLWSEVYEVPKVRTLDGRPIDFSLHGSAAMLPGPHVLGVRVRWSNGYAQDVELPFVARAGTRCVVKKFEGEPPRPPARPVSVGEGVVLGAAAGAVGTLAFYTVPFWGPPALIIWAVSPKPKEPPKGHGMYVWMEVDGRAGSIAEWKSEWGTSRGVAVARTD